MTFVLVTAFFRICYPSDVAHYCGYYDQAHMIHEFQQFTGHSPTAYRALKLPHAGGVIGD